MEIINIASGSSANSYFVSDGKTSILVEAGVNMRTLVTSLGTERLKEVQACVISHSHL